MMGATMLSLVLTALIVLESHGQSVNGVILGTITDASGGSVQGALLTITDVGEETSFTAESGPHGYYQFPNLKPGWYRITAARDGFAPAHSESLQLGAREMRRVDLKLALAARADAIDVEAAAPRISTENGVIASALNFEQLIRLPANFRAPGGTFYSVLSVVPGVQGDAGLTFSIGGGLPAQADYSLDGISTRDNRRHGPLMGSAPSPEMIAELRVTSSGGGAAYGSMGDVTITTKSGGNTPHGSLLWYHQNSALNALPLESAGTAVHSVYHNFGASMSGPVILPGVYNGRARTFFFAAYEGTRWPRPVTMRLNLPTAAMRLGALDGVPGPAAIDPATGAPFPGNRIPASSLNRVATKLLDRYYPLPNNLTPGAALNYSVQARTDEQWNRPNFRLDHVLSARQRVFFRWSSSPSVWLIPGFAPLPTTRLEYGNRDMIVSHLSTLGAGLTNDFRAGMSLYRSKETFPIRGRDAVAELGLAGLDLTNVGDAGGFPAFLFQPGTFAPVGHGRPTRDRSRTVQAANTLNLVRHRHTLAAGIDFRHTGFQAALGRTSGDDFGTFVFYDNAFTRNGYADFLLGWPTQTNYAVLGPDIDERSVDTAVFADDRWRVTPRLTVQLGLRWEVHPPMREKAGNLANFDHSTGAVVIPDRSVAPAPGFLASINACTVSQAPNCTRILKASEAGLPRGLRQTNFGNWSPRIGFAWHPGADGKTVLRGAAGIYTQVLRGMVARVMAGAYSSDVRTIVNAPTAAGQPLIVLPNILPGSGALGLLGVQDFASGTDPTLRDPRSYQWSLTLEREVPLRMSIRASYIGVQSVGIPVLADFNQTPASTTPYSPSRKPFPQWGRLNSVENLGFANYQGLQLEAVRRFQNDTWFQASYVFSRNIGTTGAPTPAPYLPPELKGRTITDRFNTRYDRGEVDASRRQRFLLTGLFPVPSGQPRAAAARALLSGWQLSTVILLQSGPHQTPSMPAAYDQSNTNLAGRQVFARPDRVGDGNLSSRSRDRYIDVTAFARPPAGAGRFGNAGAGVLQSPGAVAISGGLAKVFRLTEHGRLRFEATFTNIPNHPNFWPPSANIIDPNFGKLLYTQPGESAGPRTGQLGIRIDF